MSRFVRVFFASLISLLLISCSDLRNCPLSSKFVEKDDEVADGVQILLHTRPIDAVPLSSTLQEEFYHHWSLIFWFPYTDRITTHEGEEGVGCSFDDLPEVAEGSTIRVLGIVSGSPKKFANIARTIEGKITKVTRNILYSHTWAMTMVKTIGGEPWMNLRDPEAFIEDTENLYPTGKKNWFGTSKRFKENQEQNQAKHEPVRAILLQDKSIRL